MITYEMFGLVIIAIVLLAFVLCGVTVLFATSRIAYYKSRWMKALDTADSMADSLARYYRPIPTSQSGYTGYTGYTETGHTKWR